MSPHPVFASTLRTMAGVAPEVKFYEAAAPADIAVARIRELELEVANCRRLIAETRDQLNALCPADTVAVMPDGAEVLADESVVQEAAAWILGKHSVEFAEQINERQLVAIEAEKRHVVESDAMVRELSR